MMTLSLSYIQKALGKGESEDQIRKFLRMQGISDTDINEAFNKIKQSSTETDPKDFLASNVSKQPRPSRPTIPLAKNQPSATTDGTTQPSRLQYAPKKGLGLTFWLVVSIVLIVGLGTIGYLYFDEIYNSVFKIITTEEPTPEPTTTLPVVKDVILPEEKEEEEEKKPTNINLVKIDLIKQAQTFLTDKFNADGVYPQTYNIADDADSFYCYRKNGTHYILGTTLDVGQVALETDLDGDYFCGDTIKKCPDPVYCVGP